MSFSSKPSPKAVKSRMVYIPRAVVTVVTLFTVCLATADTGASGTRHCSPTPTQITAGPLYLPHAPRKSHICDPRPSEEVTLRILTDKGNCNGGFCWGLTRNTSTAVPRIRISGVVQDTECNPIPGAQLDIWQPSPEGQYGPVRPELNQTGYCRGVVTADSNGRYEFETYPSGSYGLFSGFLPLVGDLPPWVPRHIHAIVWSKGHKILQTQLYFENDPTVDFDFRAELASQSLGANEKALRLHFSPCAAGSQMECATMDFVLPKVPEGAKEATLTTLEAAAFHVNCEGDWNPGQPWPLCHPWAIPFVRADLMLGTFFLIIFGLLAVVGAIGACCFRKFFGPRRRPGLNSKGQRVGLSKSKAE